jgi:hypothetical protein
LQMKDAMVKRRTRAGPIIRTASAPVAKSTRLFNRPVQESCRNASRYTKTWYAATFF